jgi:hypothetical protein
MNKFTSKIKAVDVDFVVRRIDEDETIDGWVSEWSFSLFNKSFTGSDDFMTPTLEQSILDTQHKQIGELIDKLVATKGEFDPGKKVDAPKAPSAPEDQPSDEPTTPDTAEKPVDLPTEGGDEAVTLENMSLDELIARAKDAYKVEIIKKPGLSKATVINAIEQAKAAA